ncbi:MAG: GTPase RsgA [Candidatus Heimdallarchaeota archaeon]|nr:GTPase RsgA [Candidatus Heimdallarchaeota archaeon]
MPRKDDYDTMVYKMIKGSDVIIEVVDARFPSLSRTKKYENMVLRNSSKTLLIAMNKVDLVPNHIVSKWKKILEKEKITIIPTSARERLSTAVLRNKILSSVNKEFFYITSCFIGLPNTGKSSLINILKGRSSAPVAPIPGYTKALQVLRITTRLRIFDTPGVIPFKMSMADQILLGIARPERLSDPVKAAWSLIHRINEIDPDTISKTYEIEYESPPEFLEKFAEKRHKIRKGGELDLETAARVFLTEHNNKAKIPIWEDPDQYLIEKREKERSSKK